MSYDRGRMGACRSARVVRPISSAPKMLAWLLAIVFARGVVDVGVVSSYLSEAYRRVDGAVGSIDHADVVSKW